MAEAPKPPNPTSPPQPGERTFPRRIQEADPGTKRQPPGTGPQTKRLVE